MHRHRMFPQSRAMCTGVYPVALYLIMVKNHGTSNLVYSDWRQYERVERDCKKPSGEKKYITLVFKKENPKGKWLYFVNSKDCMNKVFGNISINNQL